MLRQLILAITADGLKRIIVDLAAGHDGNGVIEQPDELPQHARLGLAAQAEKEHVVLGKNGVVHLRQHGFLVAEDAVEDGRAGRLRVAAAAAQQADQIAPHFVFDADNAITAGLELAKCFWQVHDLEGVLSQRRLDRLPTEEQSLVALALYGSIQVQPTFWQ